MKALDLRGLVPAPVTPLTRDGDVDHAAIKRLGSWLGSFKEVKGLTVLGHAGEGTFFTPDEQMDPTQHERSRNRPHPLRRHQHQRPYLVPQHLRTSSKRRGTDVTMQGIGHVPLQEILSRPTRGRVADAMSCWRDCACMGSVRRPTGRV